jgi:NADH:ubiquinone oxidoreductase subunit H
MLNILDLTTTYYQKWVETTFLKNNILDSLTKLIFIINDKINLLVPELIITTNMSDAIITALKFLTLIAMLVFIRGGIPRYRYDFLTKIGWIKFLSLVLAVFLSTLLLVYIM